MNAYFSLLNSQIDFRNRCTLRSIKSGDFQLRLCSILSVSCSSCRASGLETVFMLRFRVLYWLIIFYSCESFLILKCTSPNFLADFSNWTPWQQIFLVFLRFSFQCLNIKSEISGRLTRIVHRWLLLLNIVGGVVLLNLHGLLCLLYLYRHFLYLNRRFYELGVLSFLLWIDNFFYIIQTLNAC